MKHGKIETAVGIFVLIGILCSGYLAVRLGRMELLGGDFYRLDAMFNSVSGLKKGAIVEISGVAVGRVAGISLDPSSQMARVALEVKNGVSLHDDAIASVKTSGLIGDKYVSISPGGSANDLKSGDTIIDTESPLDIEALIGKYMVGSVK
ncbi:MAG: outer membrane lipid asymmetry maintenance protein MlaD [Desulfatitalea sp.]|nr:outer membrane lipid asymmetry maintenance protein MlaD [Desulfatitalea sp.]NNK00368.1 outer membrane lipid asymmetry maintenance protein MlaD [Desulfatitalea sp.]